jgi:predicted phage tail protein
MRVSWDQAQNAIAYEAQWRRNDGNWVNVPRSPPRHSTSRIYAGATGACAQSMPQKSHPDGAIQKRKR